MASAVLHAKVWPLLIAVVVGNRIQRSTQALTTDQAQGGSSSSTGCVEVSGSKLKNAMFCQGDGWFRSGSQCCNNGYITCKEAQSTFCTGDWKYLGSSRCCTTNWAECIDADSTFCKGDSFSYLGNRQCCLTTPSKTYLTSEKADSTFCKRPWKYMGNQQCITTEYSHCEENVDSTFCKEEGWTYLGNKKCCTTSPYSIELQCEVGYTDSSCRSRGYKYMGGGKCCWSKYFGKW